MGRKPKVSLNTAKQVIISEILSDLYTDHEGVNCYNTVYMEGTMGIGKSTVIRSIVDFLTKFTGKQWGFLDLRFATLTASDIQGIPQPVQQEDGTWVMKWMKDAVLPGINKDLPEYGLVLMDEINQVKDVQVKSVLYQFLLDKKINDYTLPKHWYQACAGNREEDGGVYDRLSAPVRDRMMILEIEMSPTETLQYFKDNDFHPTVINYVESKLRKNVNVLHTYNAELEMAGDEDCENYVFCTPRTYEFVSNALKAHEQLKSYSGRNPSVVDYVTSSHVLKARICGLMGEKEGLDFFSTYKQVNSIDLTNIINAKWSSDKPDRDLPTLQEYKGNAYIQSYIASQMNDKTVDKNTKISIMKWLVYIKVDAPTIASAYHWLNEEAKQQLTRDLYTDKCTEMINIISKSTQNNKFTV